MPLKQLYCSIALLEEKKERKLLGRQELLLTATAKGNAEESLCSRIHFGQQLSSISSTSLLHRHPS
jgi:hypothetical protein